MLQVIQDSTKLRLREIQELPQSMNIFSFFALHIFVCFVADFNGKAILRNWSPQAFKMCVSVVFECIKNHFMAFKEYTN